MVTESSAGPVNVPHAKAPRTSVITPFYNAEKFLSEAIESVRAQTDPAWELILVDDGSTDSSAEIAKGYASAHAPQIRLIAHSDGANHGISASRNLGFQHAKGNYIAFLDADDVWFPRKLAEQCAILDRYPEALMVFGASEYWHSWTGIEGSEKRDYTPGPGTKTNTLVLPPALITKLYPLGQGTPPPPSDFLFRRELFTRVGGFENEFRGMYEDQVFLVKAYLEGPIYVAEECWDRYRIHDESCLTSAVRAGQYQESRLEFFRWLKGYLQRRGVEDSSIWESLQAAIVSGELPHGVTHYGGWQLRTAGASRANLSALPGVPDGVRVEISHSNPDLPFDVQLNRPGVRFVAGNRYILRFEARADGVRTAFAGVARDHAPWAGLGLYQEFEATPLWRTEQFEFTAQNTCEFARIHFDLGTHQTAMEFRNVAVLEKVDPTRVSPRATVIITTYNFEEYIADALDSVLMQDVSFPYEIIVLDDCSTDSTKDILQRYQEMHPGRLQVHLAPRNACDNLATLQTVTACSSDYIVVLDGDDYWVSRDKLQRQVEFLDQHPECSLCFHNTSMVWEDSSGPTELSNPPDQKPISTLDDLIDGCFIVTCSAMFRRSAISALPASFVDEFCADWALFVQAAQKGLIGYLPEVMAVYRRRRTGFWTGRSRVEQLQRTAEFYERRLADMPLRYRERISIMLSRQYFQLAIEHQRSGDGASAAELLLMGYRTQPDARRSRWSLRTAGGVDATLEFPDALPSVVRVEIKQLASAEPWDLQLNRSHLAVEANQEFVLQFRARADGPRSLQVGVSEDEPPWSNLGHYRSFDLDRQWKLFRSSFVASSGTAAARIHFDAGSNGQAFELSHVTLQDLQGRETDQLQLPDELDWKFAALSTSADSDYKGWNFRVAGSSRARLQAASDDAFRVEIQSTESSQAFDIQVARPCCAVRAGCRYRLVFRARADAERIIGVGIGLAHAPWSGLGLYQTFKLSPHWLHYEAQFEATGSETSARIHFDVGDSNVSVQVEAIAISLLPEGLILGPGETYRDQEASTAEIEAQREEASPPPGRVDFGSLRRVTPISRDWGFDRGLPVDRYYIRQFLSSNSDAIQGRVLEIGDNAYTMEFGGTRVVQSDVLNVVDGVPNTTIVADLGSAPDIESCSFDCIVLTQTLQLIFDLPAVIDTLHRILKKGGVLLATVPGISQTYDPEWANDWYWCFTSKSIRRLLEKQFAASRIEVKSFGNPLTAMAFLHGLATEELTARELLHFEPGYEVLISARARKQAD